MGMWIEFREKQFSAAKIYGNQEKKNLKNAIGRLRSGSDELFHPPQAFDPPALRMKTYAAPAAPASRPFACGRGILMPERLRERVPMDFSGGTLNCIKFTRTKIPLMVRQAHQPGDLP